MLRWCRFGSLILCLGLGSCTQVQHLFRQWFGGESVIDTSKRRMDADRSYREVTLENGLQVLLISDPTFSKSAAALDVGVGSLMDPPERLGLAHFLEHMLFLGTDRYPDVEEYSRYLNTFDGHSNAYTAAENTNYHFEVSHEGFEGALDRFSRFFIAPRMDEAFVDRELNAVHSEHQKNLQDDLWRTRSILRLLHKDGHPRQKFSTGDRSTLGGVSREELLNFYQTYYSSNQMRLVVMDRTDLDSLEKMVQEKFSEVPKQHRESVKVDQNIFDQKQLPRLVAVEPVKDLRRLSFVFAAPSPLSYWKTKPGSAISHILGYEGAGSLLSWLKHEDLATGLSAWLEPSSYAGVFHFDVDLTEKGLKEYEEVVAAFFGYINLMKKSSYPKHIHHEQQAMSAINYVYADGLEGVGAASRYASLMHRYPALLLDQRDQLIEEYSDEDYKLFLNVIQPENLNLFLIAHDVPTDQVEEFYKTKYQVSAIEKEKSELWKVSVPHKDMTLPSENVFIPDHLSLQEVDAKPRKIIDEPWGVIWAQHDQQFDLPKSYVRLHLMTPYTGGDARHKMMSVLYTMVIHEALNEWKYDLSMAGLDVNIVRSDEGVLLDVAGYSERLPLLIEETLGRLNDIAIDKTRFATVKADLQRTIENSRLDAEYQQALYEARFILDDRSNHREEYYDPSQKIDLLTAVTLEDLQMWLRSLYQNVYIEGSAFGNFDYDEISEACRKGYRKLNAQPLSKEEIAKTRSSRYQLDQEYGLLKSNPQSNNHVWLMATQVGARTDELSAILRIGQNILKSSFYTELRTKQQLGYIVHSGMNNHTTVLGLLFLVQSSDYDSMQIDERARAWMKTAVEELKNLTEDQFEVYKQGVISSLLEKPQNLYEAHESFFFESIELKGQFGYRAQIAEIAKTITKKNVEEVFEKHFNNLKSMSIYLVAGDKKVKPHKDVKQLLDVSKFRKEQGTWPSE
ncbi:MAG: insulinase family protein [Oligoflexales bacterium]